MNTSFRILAALVILLSLVFGPWWLPVTLSIVAVFLFINYYEMVLWGVMMDALYGLPIEQFDGYRYVFTTASVILFLAVFFVRKYFAIYETTI